MKHYFYRFFILLAAAYAAVAGAAEPAVQSVNVSSDEVEYGVDGKNALFRGNVEVQFGQLTLHAATLQVQQQGKFNLYTARAAAAPIVARCADCADFSLRAEIKDQAVYSDEHENLLLTGGILICAGDSCRQGKLNAERADWQADKQQVILNGDPVTGRWQLTDTDEVVQVQAQQIVYHFASREAVLSGEARVTRGNSNILGTTIRINIQSGSLSAQSDKKQRVQANFTQE